MTHEEFLKKLWDKNEHYRNGNFEVVGEYVNWRERIIIKDKYGLISLTPDSLLKSQKGSITQAVNKEEYYHNILKEVNQNIARQIKILEYRSDRKGILIETKYGICLTKTSTLNKLEKVSIQTALNKSDFWVQRALDLREDSERIDYSKANYSCNKEQVTLYCKIHEYSYTQRPSHHMANIQGCPHCATNTIKYSKENFDRHREFFKDRKGVLYVLKLTGENECFYKVGITGRDEKYRLSTISHSYNVVIEYIQEMYIEEAYNLEQFFLKDFENRKYIPKIKFKGYTECLTTNPVAEYYHWFNNR
jgi:hypothetical protein